MYFCFVDHALLLHGAGSCAIAAETRFCTSTCAKSRSVPTCEGHDQRVGAVVGRCGLHVEHLLDAVDLLLDRQGHGVDEGLGVGAGVAAW